MEKFLTSPQIASALQVTIDTVWRWIRRKQLRAVKFGRKGYRITEADFNEFIKKHKTYE